MQVSGLRGRLSSKSGMLTRLRRALSGEVAPERDVFNGKRLVKVRGCGCALPYGAVWCHVPEDTGVLLGLARVLGFDGGTWRLCLGK